MPKSNAAVSGFVLSVRRVCFLLVLAVLPHAAHTQSSTQTSTADPVTSSQMYLDKQRSRPSTPELNYAEIAMLMANQDAERAAPDRRGQLHNWNSWSEWQAYAECAQDGPAVPFDSDWLVAHPDEMRCVAKRLESRTATLKRFTAEAKSGAISPDTLKALEAHPRQPNVSPELAAHEEAVKTKPAAPMSINAWNGTGAKLEHTANGAFLSYSDAGGSLHRYAVARPKMLQGMTHDDLGSWLYVAPDHSSGTMFQLDASGNLLGSPVDPLKLKFLAAP